MDLNGDMELDNYEINLSNVSEGANYSDEVVTKDMARMAIESTISENRNITRNVSVGIYSGIKDKLQEYDNVKGLGK